jgi:hypothetical protein
MAAERKPGSDRGRPALDWNRAFLFYAALPSEERSYAAVAAEFAVSARTVERHGCEERWRERALEIDRQAAATAAARLADQRAATLTDLEKLVEASLVSFAQKLREGTVRLGAADLPRLHKLLKELWAEPGVRPSVPSAPEPGGGELDPVEHKRQVLQALHEAGVLERHDHPRDRHHDHDRDDDRDGEGGRGSDGALPDVGRKGEEGELPPQSEAVR